MSTNDESAESHVIVFPLRLGLKYATPAIITMEYTVRERGKLEVRYCEISLEESVRRDTGSMVNYVTLKQPVLFERVCRKQLRSLMQRILDNTTTRKWGSEEELYEKKPDSFPSLSSKMPSTSKEEGKTHIPTLSEWDEVEPILTDPHESVNLRNDLQDREFVDATQRTELLSTWNGSTSTTTNTTTRADPNEGVSGDTIDIPTTKPHLGNVTDPNSDEDMAENSLEGVDKDDGGFDEEKEDPTGSNMVDAEESSGSSDESIPEDVGSGSSSGSDEGGSIASFDVAEEDSGGSDEGWIGVA